MKPRREVIGWLEVAGWLKELWSRRLGSAALNGAKDPSSGEIALTPEQKQKAARITEVLAKHFGINPAEFGAVPVKKRDGIQVAVVLTSEGGIYRGSGNQVLNRKNDKDFMVEIDGEEVDTRSVMTLSVYQAFIADASNRGVEPLPVLPDSIKGENGGVRTKTLLTGDSVDGHDVLVAWVAGRQVVDTWYRRDYDSPTLRVRPGVLIKLDPS